MMLESGRIRLVRPSAVIITHKTWAPGLTLENFIHKDRPRNVGCVHLSVNLDTNHAGYSGHTLRFSDGPYESNFLKLGRARAKNGW